MPSNAEKPRRGLFRRTQKTPKSSPGRIRQVVNFYKQTSQVDKSIPWWTWGSLLGVIAAGVLVGFLLGRPVYAAVLSIPLSLVVALSVMLRRGERAAFRAMEGHQGAAAVALRGLRGRQWTVQEEPVALDPKTRDLVMRVVGPVGVVLVGEGPPHRVTKMLAAEERKAKRVLSSVPVHTVQAGQGKGQVEPRKVPSHIMRIKGTKLSKAEIAEVQRRLKALGGLNVPIPKGVDPNRARMDRRAMRGR
ncbi:MAG: hypothetical protein CSA58_10375 [Micrococcales bacterium]|nr:MAG: hypothetical protein CSA58_10375 [Micrococcales bacterium]